MSIAMLDLQCLATFAIPTVTAGVPGSSEHPNTASFSQKHAIKNPTALSQTTTALGVKMSRRGTPHLVPASISSLGTGNVEVPRGRIGSSLRPIHPATALATSRPRHRAAALCITWPREGGQSEIDKKPSIGARQQLRPRSSQCLRQLLRNGKYNHRGQDRQLMLGICMASHSIHP